MFILYIIAIKNHQVLNKKIYFNKHLIAMELSHQSTWVHPKMTVFELSDMILESEWLKYRKTKHVYLV